MSIRFATPKPALHACIRPSSGSLAFPRAVNDNGDIAPGENALGDTGLGDTGLAAALRHFARHGLAAANDAHDKAMAAFENGDHPEFARWRDICAALDRRLARQLPPPGAKSMSRHHASAPLWQLKQDT